MFLFIMVDAYHETAGFLEIGPESQVEDNVPLDHFQLQFLTTRCCIENC